MKDTRDSSLTCVHLTILPVGAAAPDTAFTEAGYLFASDLNTPRRFETLASMLADRGHSATRIEKILGKNLLRVFADVWKA